LHNFLGPYTSRYSDYDGYWLFGKFVSDLDHMSIDLLLLQQSSQSEGPIKVARRLAATKFHEQTRKAGLSMSCVAEATLTITKESDITVGKINGHTCSGHRVTFFARAVSDQGKEYSCSRRVFIAVHNPRAERRSARSAQSQ